MVVSGNDSSTIVAVQARATQLLAHADMVERSNHERKEMLEDLKDTGVFDSDGDLSLTTPTSPGDTDVPLSNQEGASSILPTSSIPIVTDSKKSRFQTVSELKQQVQDCQRALMTMQENANLKYRKLELQTVDLRSSLDKAKADLDRSNIEIHKIEQEKQMLEDSLNQAVGKDQAALIKDLKAKNKAVETQLATITQELNTAVKEKQFMEKAMEECPTCTRQIPDKDVGHKSISNSFWSTFNEAMKGLNVEAEVTASPIVQRSALVNPTSPPPKLFLFKEQSNQIKKELEEDIEAMEKQMKDDIDALKNEWSKPLTKSTGRSRKKHSSSSRSGRTSKRGSATAAITEGFASLDAFFATASQDLNLGDEEMDEEMSFYSKARSVSTAPVLGAKKKTKKVSSMSSVANTSSADRRSRYGSQGSTFRSSFRARMLGLGDEVSVRSLSLPSGSANKSAIQRKDTSTTAQRESAEKKVVSRLSDIQREVAEWGGKNVKHTVTVL